MNNITIRLAATGEQREFPLGSTLDEIREGFGLNPELPYVSAHVNNQGAGLGFRVFGNKDVRFLDITSQSGMRTYVRSLCFVLCKAVYDLYPEHKLLIEHPVSDGYYCYVDGVANDAALVAAVKERMKQLIEASLPVRRVEAPTDEVIARYRRQGMEDKALLLETIGSLYSVYYELDGYADNFYRPLLRNTSALTVFDLISYNEGMLLQVPKSDNPAAVAPLIKQDKMLDAFREYISWQKIMKLSNVGDLNVMVQNGEAGQLICIGEALQEKRIIRIADEIQRRQSIGSGLRMVLISGPSSSGKTTFSKRLSIQLLANGIRPYPISLDDYFVDRTRTPLNEQGEYDYESLYALDLELFNQHLEQLMNGEEVELPTYNFITGEREYRGNKLRLTENIVLVLEGIHALNPELTAHIPDEQKYRVYVSALTTMSLDDHNWISTTDTRLVRRIVRDFRYRGQSAADTIRRWPDVRAGEEKWIFPYQENADDMFNSALIFEFAFLRRYVEPLLQSVPQNISQYADSSRLLSFMSHFTPIEENDIPVTSLMREFVGGSVFKY